MSAETSIENSVERSSPRVLISYSHDSDAHSANVLQLSDKLREQGINCWIDQYEPVPSEGWPVWMERQIEKADFVLCICTSEYEKRFRKNSDPNVGLGVAWESMLVTNALYQSKGGNKKFLVVQLSERDLNCIPNALRGYTLFVLKRFDLNDPGYENLYRFITKQPATPGLVIGERIELREKRSTAIPEHIPALEFLQLQKSGKLKQLELGIDERSSTASDDTQQDNTPCERAKSYVRLYQLAELEAIATNSKSVGEIRLKKEEFQRLQESLCGEAIQVVDRTQTWTASLRTKVFNPISIATILAVLIAGFGSRAYFVDVPQRTSVTGKQFTSDYFTSRSNADLTRLGREFATGVPVDRASPLRIAISERPMQPVSEFTGELRGINSETSEILVRFAEPQNMREFDWIEVSGKIKLGTKLAPVVTEAVIHNRMLRADGCYTIELLRRDESYSKSLGIGSEFSHEPFNWVNWRCRLYDVDAGMRTTLAYINPVDDQGNTCNLVTEKYDTGPIICTEMDASLLQKLKADDEIKIYGRIVRFDGRALHIGSATAEILKR